VSRILNSCQVQPESDGVREANTILKANLLPFLDIPADRETRRRKTGNGERIKKVERAAHVVQVFTQVAADLLEDAAAHGPSRALPAMELDDTLTAHQVAGVALMEAMKRRHHLPRLAETDARTHLQLSIDSAPNDDSRSVLSPLHPVHAAGMLHLTSLLPGRFPRDNEGVIHATLLEAARIVKSIGEEAKEALERTVRDKRQRSLCLEANQLAKATLSRVRDYLLRQSSRNESEATQAIDRRALMDGISKVGEVKNDIVVSSTILSQSFSRC
jgi:hypothetical protein